MSSYTHQNFIGSVTGHLEWKIGDYMLVCVNNWSGMLGIATISNEVCFISIR